MVDVSALRAEFAQLQRNAEHVVLRAVWRSAVEALLPKRKSRRNPSHWVKAARAAQVTCPSCGGSGMYYWGACVNGVMTHSGPCYRCNGTGKQGQEDFRRNWGYDMHRKVV
jgi:hypothetical protein